MTSTEGRIAFDRFALDLETRELFCDGKCDGKKVSLQEKPFRLLLALLERPGRVATRTELYDALWATDAYVDREAGLNTAVRKLRGALGELSGSSQLLKTVPRIGYRLSVEETPPEPSPRAAASPRAPAVPHLSRALMITVGIAITVLGLATLGLTTLGRGPGADPEPMPSSPELRARYIEARSLMGTMGGDLSRARDLLRSLAEEAPGFAPAHAYLAEASARHAMRTASAADLDEARQAAHRAQKLDPNSAVAHRVLAMVALNFDWDVTTAGRLLAKALHLDPTDPVNHLAKAAHESALGRHDEAIEAIRRAVDLDPDSMSIRSDAGHFLLRAGRFREAVAECEMVLRLDAASVFARECLLTAYSLSDDFDAARAQAISLLQHAGASEAEVEEASTAQDPRRIYLSWQLERLLARPDRAAVQIATHYVALGDDEQALPWLEQAARERAPLLIFVPQHSGFKRLRDDPRYRQILRQAGLEALG